MNFLSRKVNFSDQKENFIYIKYKCMCKCDLGTESWVQNLALVCSQISNAFESTPVFPDNTEKEMGLWKDMLEKPKYTNCLVFIQYQQVFAGECYENHSINSRIDIKFLYSLMAQILHGPTLKEPEWMHRMKLPNTNLFWVFSLISFLPSQCFFTWSEKREVKISRCINMTNSWSST